MLGLRHPIDDQQAPDDQSNFRLKDSPENLMIQGADDMKVSSGQGLIIIENVEKQTKKIEMKNNKKYSIITLLILAVGAWVCFKTTTVVVIFTSSFTDMDAKILLNEKMVLDTILNSDPSTGFTMSYVVNASITDKIIIKVDNFKFKIRPQMLKSRYLIRRSSPDSVYIRQLYNSEKVEFY